MKKCIIELRQHDATICARAINENVSHNELSTIGEKYTCIKVYCDTAITAKIEFLLRTIAKNKQLIRSTNDIRFSGLTDNCVYVVEPHA